MSTNVRGRGRRTQALPKMQVSKLSQFQEEKLLIYFNFFDDNKDGLLEKNDFENLQRKIVDYAAWPEKSSLANWCREIHNTFFHSLCERKAAMILDASDDGSHDISIIKDTDTTHIAVEEWLSMWEKLLHGAMSMNDFPVWLQLLPKVLFEVVDVKGDSVIDEEELEEYYSGFLKLEDHDPKDIARRAYNDITDNGKYPLNVQSFEQCFANFLLGRSTNFGPGKYILAAFVDTIEDKIQIILPKDDVIERRPGAKRRRFSSNPSVKRYWRNA
ncbi:sarcoplasmic calcium-binding proteins II, V, VI, and VII-like [Tubulanus polymorphus]|uniref:sarcoplasmic calcium-binding proteins II, V, VI, and VII-like n=1 Tax=Tubulanus polymorphus TaxID=672921 RepID=UPI003DA2B5CE